MAFSLYEHNMTAYENVVNKFKETKKTAIIHPTGTGKSFIGFKLCADNPNKRICWVSPSEYIFKTQIENLKKVSNGYFPNNITFFTYARLMNLTQEEIGEILPDYIILDEFHRCGAKMWGQGVANLLNAYPDAYILGLSATAIRYLDSKRDMSDELFDGNIASEMTLGEAIVRGILNPPKYVLSVFSYEKDLERYEKRIRNNKSKLVRDEGEKYLNALKRTLEQADGIDEIFYKHIEDRCGKYIVFCANYEHMREMIKMSQNWFYKVDENPHIYCAYSNNPETDFEFEKFKADNSAHLKLLFCIDMLNEGVHVDDVSGVILLRPTVSPVIYKQQIGRALSANKKKNAVIFDIVLNIENLYSIDEIKEEMEIATSYYRTLGEDNLIVNEHFKIIDEVKNCMELFDKLENILTASWETMYSFAKEYYDEFGNLEVPARYFTKDGYSLGSWIYNQRSIRKGLIDGKLTDTQIELLNKIGMRWNMLTDYSWEINFNLAKEYFDTYKNLNVPVNFVTKDGVRLGNWLSNIRAWESAGTHPKYLTNERKEELNKIGMVWSKSNFYWERNYAELYNFYKENGNLIVPCNYVTKNGIKLGSWVGRLRKLYKGEAKGTPLTKEQIERLNNIGMVWEPDSLRKWDNAYNLAKEYYIRNKNLNISTSYKTENGFNLGQWIKVQRCEYEKGTLNPEKIERLNKIGMTWKTEDKWQYKYNLAKEFFDETGAKNISQKIIIDGIWLGKWLSKQKEFYKKNIKLTKPQRKLMAELINANAEYIPHPHGPIAVNGREYCFEDGF